MSSSIFRKGPPLQEKGKLEIIVSRYLTETAAVNRKGRIYGSEAGFCSTMSAINGQRIGEDDISAAGKFYMGIGVAIHDLVKKSFERAGMTVYNEYHLPEIGINLGGYVDIIVMHEGEPHIIEVKSCGKLPAVAKPQHEAQASLYGAVLGIPATVLYVSRSVNDFFGNLLVRAIPVRNTEEARRTVLFNASLAHLSIIKGIIPAKVFMTDDSCRYCPFHSFCWSGGNLPAGMKVADAMTEASLRVKAAALADDLLSKTDERYQAFMSEVSDANKASPTSKRTV